eukprot:2633301-Amphidinium_carterae.1
MLKREGRPSTTNVPKPRSPRYLRRARQSSDRRGSSGVADEGSQWSSGELVLFQCRHSFH